VAAVACLRLRELVVLPEPVRLSAAAARQARYWPEPGASVQQARRRAEPEASAEQARHRVQPRVSAQQARPRVQPGVLAEPGQRPGAQVVSEQQAAALPEGRDAAAGRLPVADAVGAAPDAEAALRPEVPRALAAEVPGAEVAAAVPPAWAAPGALVLPLAVPSALVFRPDRLRSLAPPPAVRFGRATTGLRIASP
jgi:hypothetical protein